MRGMGAASQVTGPLRVSEVGEGRQRAAGGGGEWRVALLAVGVFALLSVLAGITSPGFLETDACTHYLYARFAFAEPAYLTDVWGRPFCTGIYALPAVLAGRTGVRIMSMLVAVGTGLLTWSIARRQGYRRPVLALIFLLGQPLLFLHSFSELTELPFAFLVALGFWALQRQRWLLFALTAGLMPAARPEGFGFIVLAAAALVAHYRDWWAPVALLIAVAVGLMTPPQHQEKAIGAMLVALGVLCILRRCAWLAILVAPLALWSFTGWYQFGGFKREQWLMGILGWLAENWPYATDSLYSSGTLVHFVVFLPVVVSPVAFPAVLTGFWRALRRDSAAASLAERADRQHLLRCQRLIALVPLMILAGHSLLYWLGKMASNGELRYMLVVAPFWALLAAMGWEWIAVRLNIRRAVMWAGVGVLFPVIVNLAWGVVPVQIKDKDWLVAHEVATWYQTAPQREDYPMLVTTHRAVNYFLDISPTDKSRCVEWKRSVIAPVPPGEPPRGVMLIWDPNYGFFWNSDKELSIDVQTLLDAGWVPIRQFQEKEQKPEGALGELEHRLNKTPAGQWHVFLSPRDKHGRMKNSATE